MGTSNGGKYYVMANSEYLGFDAEVLFYDISSIKWVSE